MNSLNNKKPKSYLFLIVISVIVLLITNSCASSKTSLKSGIEEIRPGVISGYLQVRELPNSLALLPPPPEEGSTAFKLDEEISINSLESGDSARWEQAKTDAILYFPDALQAFSDLLDIEISETKTPNLYMILRRSLSDASLSTYTAKNHYKRKRPFMVNNQPSCTPEDEEHLMKDGSYPSGHTAIGWTWALILCEIFPERTNQLIKRGREFGESRVVCNVHWQSDVNEGRFMGAATVARLHANPTFQADLKAAKKEVNKLRAQK